MATIAKPQISAQKFGVNKPDPNKSAWQKMSDDFLMDFGMKSKDSDYYARLPGRQIATQKAMSQNSSGSSDGPATPRKTSRQIYEETKAAALAKLRSEGQARRKKFEQDKGKRVAEFRKKYSLLFSETKETT